MTHVQTSVALLVLVVLVGCETAPPASEAPPQASEATAATAPAASGAGASACATVTDIEGPYACSGQCVVTTNGVRSVVTIQERDSIAAVSGATAALYEVTITAEGFREVEIGGLAETTLRTATAEVTDGVFPVLEEYVFETGAGCQAEGFTKIVRGPGQAAFKACAISCRKV